MSNVNQYWFESELDRQVHDVTTEKFLIHAKAINEIIKPYIINSSDKVRWTKGLGQDTYSHPHLIVRASDDEQDGNGMPFIVMMAEIVNPKTGVGFVCDMKLDNPDVITALDFAIFGEKCLSALNAYRADKGRIAKEGIII